MRPAYNIIHVHDNVMWDSQYSAKDSHIAYIELLTINTVFSEVMVIRYALFLIPSLNTPNCVAY